MMICKKMKIQGKLLTLWHWADWQKREQHQNVISERFRIPNDISHVESNKHAEKRRWWSLKKERQVTENMEMNRFNLRSFTRSYKKSSCGLQHKRSFGFWRFCSRAATKVQDSLLSWQYHDYSVQVKTSSDKTASHIFCFRTHISYTSGQASGEMSFRLSAVKSLCKTYPHVSLS